MHALLCAAAALALIGILVYLLTQKDGISASGSNPCVSPFPQPYTEDDYRGSYQMQNCSPHCMAQLGACRQACANMPLCDQRATCRQGCDIMAQQCMGRCPSQ
jgi:hypothetical protein